LSITIWFHCPVFDSDEPDTGSDSDSENWPDIPLDRDTTGYLVHP